MNIKTDTLFMSSFNLNKWLSTKLDKKFYSNTSLKNKFILFLYTHRFFVCLSIVLKRVIFINNALKKTNGSPVKVLFRSGANHCSMGRSTSNKKISSTLKRDATGSIDQIYLF